MRRFLRSTALALALGFFLPLPGPVTGVVFNPAAYADPVTGAIPPWIKAACCGPSDAHKLRADQIHQNPDGSWAIDGYPRPVADGEGKGPFMSQDANAWAFYREGGTNEYGNYGPSDVYCFFIVPTI